MCILAGRTVAVNPETAYYDTLKALQEAGGSFEILEVENASTEMLIDGVASGDYDLTMADSHLAAMESTYRDDIAAVPYPLLRAHATVLDLVCRALL